MGTRTYSRRAADGSRILTALGRRRIAESVIKFTASDVEPDGVLYPMVSQLQSLQNLSALSDEEFAAQLIDFITTGFYASSRAPLFYPFTQWIEETLDNGKVLEAIAQRRQDDQQFDTTFPTTQDLFADMRSNPDAYLKDLNGVPIVLGRMFPYPEWAEQFLNDVYRPAQAGYFGSGTYYMTNNALTQDVPPNKPSLSQVVRRLTGSDMAMYGFMSEEYFAGDEIKDIRARMGEERPTAVISGIKAGAVTNFSDIMGGMTNVNRRFQTWLSGLTNSFKNQFGFVHPNIGLMAAVMGYDAIAIPNGVPGVGEGHEILVLNREAVRTSTETHTGYSWTTSVEQSVKE